jgi:hypothetical protein
VHFSHIVLFFTRLLTLLLSKSTSGFGPRIFLKKSSSEHFDFSVEFLQVSNRTFSKRHKSRTRWGTDLRVGSLNAQWTKVYGPWKNLDKSSGFRIPGYRRRLNDISRISGFFKKSFSGNVLPFIGHLDTLVLLKSVNGFTLRIFLKKSCWGHFDFLI